MDVSLIMCRRTCCRQLARSLEAVIRIAFARPWKLIVVAGVKASI
jgi:hypothetical protein